MFLGTQNFYWVTIGQTFAFDEEDQEETSSGSFEDGINEYSKGVRAAITVKIFKPNIIIKVIEK